MADRIYLSCRVRGFSPQNMLRCFEKMLRAFPFSITSPGISALRVYAIEYREPPQIEIDIPGRPDPAALVQTAAEFLNPDCAFLVQGFWDLWQQAPAWTLAPAPVTLACFGPHFEDETEDHLRIDLGVDTHFIPPPSDAFARRKIHSNLRSLLRLSQDLESILPLEKRRLWTESGENFAVRMQQALHLAER